MLAIRSILLFVLTTVLVFAGWKAWGADGASTDVSMMARIRRPVALGFSPDGAWLFSANRRSGSISVVDTRSGRVRAEHELGRGLSDLATLPDGRLLAVDREGDALLILKVDGSSGRGRGEAAGRPRPGLGRWSRPTVDLRGRLDRLAQALGRDLAARPARQAPSARAVDRPAVRPAADGLGGAGIEAGRGRRLSAGGSPWSTRLATLPSRSGRSPPTTSGGWPPTPDGRSLVVAHQTLNRLARIDLRGCPLGLAAGQPPAGPPARRRARPPRPTCSRARELVDLGRTGPGRRRPRRDRLRPRGVGSPSP